VSFIEKTNTIVIHADNYIGSSTGEQLPCKPCESLPQSLKFQYFIARATEASKFANWDYLNSQQLKTKVRILILFIFSNLTLFQLSNAKHHAATAGQKIADHK
jgi:hypothetical protein